MKNYILYGTDLAADCFIYHNYNLRKQIEYCIDFQGSDFRGDDFYGIPVRSLSDISLLSHKILVPGSCDEYINKKTELESYGYKEFEDFIWADLTFKKMVVINANCHGTALLKYLNLSKNFCDHYVVYPIPNIHLNEAKEISVNVLSNADVFIHQDIREDNKIGYKLSDSYTLNFLKNTCVNITMPNLLNMGKWLYPTLEGILKKDCINLVFVDKALEEIGGALGYKGNIHEYMEGFKNFKISDEEMRILSAQIMDKLIRREKNWDIKVSKFIDENYKSIPMFVDGGHPSKYLLIEIGRQVLSLLNIDNDIADLSTYESALGMPAPLLPCVKKYHGINYAVKMEKRKSFLFEDDCYDNEECYTEEYIKEYMWWRFGQYV